MTLESASSRGTTELRVRSRSGACPPANRSTVHLAWALGFVVGASLPYSDWEVDNLGKTIPKAAKSFREKSVHLVHPLTPSELLSQHSEQDPWARETVKSSNSATLRIRSYATQVVGSRLLLASEPCNTTRKHVGEPLGKMKNGSRSSKQARIKDASNFLHNSPQSEARKAATELCRHARLALPAGSRFGKGGHHLRTKAICSMPSTRARTADCWEEVAEHQHGSDSRLYQKRRFPGPAQKVLGPCLKSWCSSCQLLWWRILWYLVLKLRSVGPGFQPPDVGLAVCFGCRIGLGTKQSAWSRMYLAYGKCNFHTASKMGLRPTARGCTLPGGPTVGPKTTQSLSVLFPFVGLRGSIASVWSALLSARCLPPKKFPISLGMLGKHWPGQAARAFQPSEEGSK